MRTCFCRSVSMFRKYVAIQKERKKNEYSRCKRKSKDSFQGKLLEMRAGGIYHGASDRGGRSIVRKLSYFYPEISVMRMRELRGEYGHNEM